MPSRSQLQWLIYAVAAAFALRFVATYDTPIDRALPFVVILIAICGFIADRFSIAIQMSAVLLLAAALFLPAERPRLLAYGIITAAAFAVAVFVAPRDLKAHVVLTVAGVLLLRWIPFAEVIVWREVVVLIGAIAVLIAFRERTPMAIAVVLAVALVTPIYPGRVLLFPFFVALLVAAPLPRIALAGVLAIAAYFARYSIAILLVVAAIAVISPSIERLRLRVPSYAAAIALFALWPWSGLVARALPRFLFAERASEKEQAVWVALAAGQSVSMDAPHGAHAVVVTASGANASRLPAGRVMGRVEAGAIRRDLRIGDIADFGFMRREHFFASRNPVPRMPLDDVHGYGQSAWLHTAGRVPIEAGHEITSLRIIAAPDLPPTTKLQIEAVEFE